MSASAILERLKAKQGNEASMGAEFSAWIGEDPISSGRGWHWSAQEIASVFAMFKNDANRSSRWQEFVEYAVKKSVRFTCADATAVMQLTSNMSSRLTLLEKVAPWIGDAAAHKAALVAACFKENRACAMSAEGIEFGGGGVRDNDSHSSAHAYGGGDDDDQYGDDHDQYGAPPAFVGSGHGGQAPLGFGGAMGGAAPAGMGPMGGVGGFPGMSVRIARVLLDAGANALLM